MTEPLDTSGTDPELSNAIAEIVIRHAQRVYGREFFVTLDFRYGIAHDVQRLERLAMVKVASLVPPGADPKP